MSRLTRGLSLLPRFLPDLIQAGRPPVLVIGLARSGTTWVASVLNRVRSVRYVHEPFNHKNVPGGAELSYLHVPAGTKDPVFREHCRGAFRGRTPGPYVLASVNWPYRRLGWWPGRTVVKDVDVCLGAGWILEELRPDLVVVERHPCAIAASWARLSFDVDTPWEKVAAQEGFLAERLGDRARVFLGATGYWERIGALWGAVYSTLRALAREHPSVLVVRHEELCRDAEGGFRRIFDRLRLPWSPAVSAWLGESGSVDGGRPYEPKRVTKSEPGKWRSELDGADARRVLEIARQFGVEYGLGPEDADGAS